MPQLGNIKKGTEIGHKSNTKYVFVLCHDCGRARWVQCVQGIPVSIRCQSCANRKSALGELNNMWRGGKHLRKDGYTSVSILPDDFFYPMANDGNYVLEHRFVMAKHLGRCLLPWEIVHHKNSKRSDNRLENLELLPDRRWHLVDQVAKQYIKRLENKMKQLQLQLRNK